MVGTLGRRRHWCSSVALVLGLTSAQSAPLAVFTVTTTADSGAGSLRQAILDANAAPGADTIDFAIATAPPHTITLTSGLPAVTDPLMIDATTQAGFAGAPIVELNGAGVFGGSNALTISAGSSTVRGLVINRVPFNGAAIQLLTNGGNTIQGNYLGTNVAGTLRLGNNRGIVLSSSGNTIGGDTAAERNVISGSTVENVRVDAAGNTIQGNYIGTDATGNVSLAPPESPNANGIFVNGAANAVIGGTTSGQGNLISGNGGNGIQLNGSGNTIRGNLIGTNAAGTSAVCNETVGIAIGSSSTNNVIGGVDSGARNVISGNCGSGINLAGSGSVATGNTIEANFIGVGADGTSALPNSGAGIKLDDSGGLGTRNTVVGGVGTASANVIALNGGDGVEVAGTVSVENTIRSNSIFGNGGLGIDLGGNGVNPNDGPDDPDTGSNNLQNFPDLDSATATTVSGSLDSEPNQVYDIDVYASPSCDDGGTNGEGATLVDSFQLTTGNSPGMAGFTNEPLATSASGVLTATATDPDGNTSEFSECVTISGGGGGGSLSGGRTAPGASYDLTAEGTADWAVWGFSDGGEQCNTPEACSTSLAPDVSKSGGTGISNLVDINAAPPIPLRGIGFVSPQPFTFAWTDGTPTSSETNARTGLQHNGGPPPLPLGVDRSTLGTGFSFTVPADTTPRKLKVWVALNRASGQLTATLSDGSAAPFSNSYNVLTADFVGALYTLDYRAASAEQTLTVSWVENADNCAAFRCDNVSIHAVALQGPGGGDADPPILMGAVTNAAPPLGVAGVWDSGSGEGPESFAVTFYSGATCETVTAFASTDELDLSLETNDRGIGAFAIDGLPPRPAGTFIAASVNGSELSNCVVADRNNVSWPTAFGLAAPDSTDGANFLRTSGQGRWFKVPVLANSRLDVTVRNLPADYDLVVFRDIKAKYAELIGGAPANVGPNLALDDLNRQGAETPVDLFNTSQYNPSTWDPTNWDPTLNNAVFSPSEWSPSEWSPSEWSATHFSPSEWSPSEWSPSEWSPSEWSPSEWSPSEWSDSPDQFSQDPWAQFSPGDPRAFAAAQTSSLVAVSAGTGTGDESVSVNTWNNTGDFYVRVQGKNGSFDADSPFTVQVSTEGNLCSGVGPQASSPTVAGSGRKTVILYDSTRLTLGSSLLTKLNTFKDRSEVLGALVDVSTFPTIASLNAQADGAPGCPYAKNLVAAAIKKIVAAYRATNPIEYVVVLGDDDVVPFYRYPDPALLGNERLYVPPVSDNTPSQASLRLGYVLSDDFLSSSTTVAIKGNDLPVPDVAIGRLVETPSDIEGMLDAYLTANGAVSPASSLVTGYDFLTDAADTIHGVLAPKIPGANEETLITNQNVSPGTVTVGDTPDRTHSWTAADLRRELLNQRHDVIFLAGHFSANDALAADYKTNVLSTELPTATANLTNAIVFSAGCHAGYNIVNDHAVTGATQTLDWAQAFAQKRATLIAGTGYQYGDTDFLAHSERIYAEFARQLGGRIGTSLLRSKQLFLEQTPGMSALDEKSLLQTTLFGLPMLNVANMTPAGLGVQPSEASPSDVDEGTPGDELGLRAANVSFPIGGTPGSKNLTGLGSDNPATWITGGDGVAIKPTQPVLPLESFNVTVPGFAARGAGFRSGTYTVTTGTVPLTAAPATELRGIHAPFFTDVFFPQQPWTLNYFGALSGSERTQLHVTPAQHLSESVKPKMTRRKFTNMGFKLFYSNNLESYCASRDDLAPCDPGQIAVTPALAAPPTITGVETSHSGTTLTFSVRVLGDAVAGIQEVWVTWTDPPPAGPAEGSGSGSWAPLDLVQDENDPTLWTGTHSTSTPGALVFTVHAANGVGRVSTDDNGGALYRHGAIPGPDATPPPGTTMSFTSGPPTSPVRYGASFSVTVDLDGSGSCSVANKVVRVGLGGAGLPVTTNASGTTPPVTLRAALSPGTYPVTASFAGDAACGASDASASVDVVQQPTAIALAFPVATLTATTSPPTPLHQRNVTFVLRKPGTTVVVILKTDPEGRVEVPQSVLQSLPAGTYTVDVYFNGVNLPGVVVMAPDDVDYGHSEAHATRELWPFTLIGLQRPPQVNAAKGGTAVPVKFSLGANRGLAIFASGYPKMGTISCATGNPTGPLVAAENTGFRYDTANRHYTYDWKTTKGWTGCRQLVLRMADGTERALWFRF